MLINSKRGSPSWQPLLLLIVFGAGIGYTCFENLPMWGGGHGSPFCIIGFFIGAVAFISGFAGFFTVAINSVSSSTETIPAHALPSRTAVATLRAGFPARNAAALGCLQVAVIAVIALACFDLWHRGGPPLTSKYGHSYWVESIVALLLSELPYTVALVRIRMVADRAGSALIMAAGTIQSLSISYFSLRYPYSHQVSWPWLTISLGLVAGLFAGLTWRSIPSRKGDVDLLLSIFFGFAAYAVLSWIVLAILRFELHKLY